MGQARVDQGVTNMASHIVGFVNSVGVVLGLWVFVPRLVQVASLALGFVALAGTVSFAQEASQKPKLVVGIVVDQMRYDYLTRFENQYGED